MLFYKNNSLLIFNTPTNLLAVVFLVFFRERAAEEMEFLWNAPITGDSPVTAAVLVLWPLRCTYSSGCSRLSHGWVKSFPPTLAAQSICDTGHCNYLWYWVQLFHCRSPTAAANTGTGRQP